MKTIEVLITWAPKTNATLLLWIDDKEVIYPSPRNAFDGKGRIEFTYESNDPDNYHEFEWSLAFPGATLHDIVVKVTWDGGATWHTVGAQKKDKENAWTSYGVAP